MRLTRPLALGPILLLVPWLLVSCGLKNSESTTLRAKVILGGTLIDGTGRAPIPDSLIIVENGKVVAAGAAKDLKIPENHIKTNATGAYVTPSTMGGRLEYGAPADLFLVAGNPLENPMLLGNPMRVMKAGEWVDGNRK